MVVLVTRVRTKKRVCSVVLFRLKDVSAYTKTTMICDTLLGIRTRKLLSEICKHKSLHHQHASALSALRQKCTRKKSLVVLFPTRVPPQASIPRPPHTQKWRRKCVCGLTRAAEFWDLARVHTLLYQLIILSSVLHVPLSTTVYTTLLKLSIMEIQILLKTHDTCRSYDCSNHSFAYICCKCQSSRHQSNGRLARNAYTCMALLCNV